ncbi:MAG: hypothetical protein AYK19_16310 [Theionarchaea archaeon DG-70-1]|nr:MAG: hypothetical protein AYK19_16310 [Theionarchaea archaeon DG-70-1]
MDIKDIIITSANMGDLFALHQTISEISENTKNLVHKSPQNQDVLTKILPFQPDFPQFTYRKRKL